MEMSAIVGKLLSGYACMIYASGMAMWMASEAVAPIRAVAEVITKLP